ncbi:hypothetical protein ACWD0J_40425, partial [Streptomyces sp. NPDC003011]
AVPVLGVGSLFLMNGVKDGALDRMTGSPVAALRVGAASGRWSGTAAAPPPHPVSSRDAASSAAGGVRLIMVRP